MNVKRRSVTVVALLAMLWSATAATASLCTAISGLARRPLSSTVDGFQNDFFADMSKWLAVPNCSDTQTSVEWTSEWTDDASVVYASNGASGSGASVRYTVKASTNGGLFNVAASAELKMTLRRGEQTAPAEASFGFDVRGVILELAGRFSPLWQGALRTTGTSGLGVYDDDLFDGAGALVVDDCAAGAEPSATELQQAERVARLAAEVNQRFRDFEAVPTALSGDVTARLAFPPTSILGALAAADVHRNGTSGFVAAAHGECRGTACGDDALRTLKQLAGADTVCANPTVMADSVYGSLRAAVSVEAGGRDVRVLGVRGTVQAVFACASGFIGVSLSTVADPDTTVSNRFLLRLFAEDSRAAIAQIKAIGMDVRGRRYGYMRRDGGSVVMTPVETDMFAYGRGGAFVDDVAVTDDALADFQAAVAKVGALLAGKYPAVNTVFAAMCDAAASAAVFRRYMAQVAHPTSYGLWSYWAEQYPGFAVARDEATNVLILQINSQINAAYTHDAADPAAVAMNSVLAAVDRDVKAACGSACSSLAVPALSADVLGDAKLRIALSAAIQVPTATLSASHVARRAAHAQLRLFREQGNNNNNNKDDDDEEQEVQMEFIAYVDASFAQKGCVLDKVSLMYSSTVGKAVVTKATVVDAASAAGVKQPVGMGLSGKTFFNTEVDAGTIDAVTAAFASAAAAVADKEKMTLQSLTQLSDRAGSTTLSAFVAGVAAQLPHGSATTVAAYLDAVRKAAEPELANANVIAFLSLDFADGACAVDLSYVTVRRIGIVASGVSWAKNVPVSRMELTLPLTTRVAFTAGSSSSGAALNDYTVTGYSRAHGFALPIRDGMRVGNAVAGFAETAVALPAYAYLTITFSGAMERGSTFSGHFAGNMTVANPDTPVTDLFSFALEEADRGDYAQTADPSSTLAALADHFMFPSGIAQHQLKEALPPFAEPLSAIIDLRSTWEEQTAWVYHTEPSPIVFVADVAFPTAAFRETVNITVNGRYEYADCVFDVPECSNARALVAALTDAFAQCGDLATFVEVGFSSPAESYDDTEGEIVVTPRYAGSIHSFVVTAPEDATSLMHSQSWASSRANPDHLSWTDLYNGVYLALLKGTSGYTYSAPQFTTVSVADAGLVDAARADFYPTEMPAVFFPAAAKLSTGVKKVALDPEFEAANASSSLRVRVRAQEVAVEGQVAMDMVFGMSLWCAPGDGVLPFFTAFTQDDGSRYDQVTVPAAPDNTFTFVARAETRHKSAVTATPAVKQWQQTVTLTPGRLLLDALVEEMPAQLPADLAPLISVERRQDPVYDHIVDGAIYFKPYSPDADTLYVPLDFTVLPTNLVAFGSAESNTQSRAVTSCPLTKSYSLSVNVQTVRGANDDGDGAETQCTGTLGVAEVTNCTAQLAANHTFSVASPSTPTLSAYLHSVIADKDAFPTWYRNRATLSTVVTVRDLVLNVDTDATSGLADEALVLTNDEAVPFAALANQTTLAYTAAVPSTQPSGRALASLLATSKRTLCRGLQQSVAAAEHFAGSDAMRQVLPFTDQDLAPIFATLVNDHLEDARDAVCDDTNEHTATLSGFCAELAGKFGYDVCGKTVLSDSGLAVPLVVTPGIKYAPVAFQFDTERLTNTPMSTGYGNSGDLLLETQISALLGLTLAFTESQTVEAKLDANSTRFSSAVGLAAQPRLQASLGSTIVTFDSSKLDLNVSIVGTLRDNNNNNNNNEDNMVETNISGSAFMQATAQNEDSYLCRVSADVPVVQHYFQRPTDGAEDTVKFSDSCLQGNFVDSLKDSMDDMTLARYFEQDPALFFKQFAAELARNLFDDILDRVTNKAIAFLGKHIQAVTSKALDSIVGPEVAAQLGTEITDMVSDIIKSGKYPDAKDLERMVLQAFSGILNKVFAGYLVEPVNTPEPGDSYTWSFRFGKQTVDDLKAIDWSCGDHGLADFKLSSQPQLVFDWKVSFDVVWSKQSGVTVSWPVSPALEGSIALNGNSLEMSGSILFLSADLSGALTATGKLSSNPLQADINFHVDAGLSASGKLGLVGKIRQKAQGQKQNSLMALPYVTAGVEASWAFDWGTQTPKPTSPASFKFVEPQLCLGSLIVDMMQQIMHEVNRIVKPLDQVFGPSGILQKPIPGISKIFGSHTNVLSILEWTCRIFSGTCQVDRVKKLVNVLNELSNDIAKIKQFNNFLNDPYGCMDFGYVYKTFKVDWNKEKPTPDAEDGSGMIPMNPTEKAGSTLSESQKSDLRSSMYRWSNGISSLPLDDVYANYSNCAGNGTNCSVGSGDKFGIKLDILEEFPVKMLSMMLGQNVPLLSLNFPDATLSYSMSWTIPIWSVPYVAVHIYAIASVSFQPPAIALMSNGIVDTVKTANPSHLFRNLAVSTQTSFVTGSLEVNGGAEGGIHLIIVKVTVNFDVMVKFLVEAKVQNLQGDNWVTFDMIGMQVRKHGINGALQLVLQLRGGFKLYVKGCVHVVVFKKCKKLAKWSWDTTLWKWSSSTDKIMSLSSGYGVIDTDAVDFSYPSYDPTNNAIDATGLGDAVYQPTYVITNEAAMLMPSGTYEANAALTRAIPSTQTISWGSKASLCKREYKVIVDGDITRPAVPLPSCVHASFEVKQSGYRTTDGYKIFRTSIMPNGRAGITFGSCKSFTLSEPLYGTTYDFYGSPACLLVVDTEYGSTVTLNGEPQAYGSAVTITGNLRKVVVALKCASLNIDVSHIHCDGLTVTIPVGVRVVQATPALAEKSTVTIDEVPENREVQLIGANPFVTFNVPAMKRLNGIATVVGNANNDNYINLDLHTPADHALVATAYPTHLVFNDSAEEDTRIMRHTNVNIRNYTLYSSPAQHSLLQLAAPQAYDAVAVAMVGSKGAVVRSELAGCDKRSSVAVKMTGEGEHTLVLGPDASLDDLQCTVRVDATDARKTGAKGGVRAIVVNASLDTRPLRWEFTDSEFSASNLLDSSDHFHVATDGLDHVTIHFSKNSNEIVVNRAKADGIEYAFVFADNSDDSSSSSSFNTVQIAETHSPLLMKGTVMNVVLGDADGTVTPLSGIGAVVVAPRGSNIALNSANTGAPTHVGIDGNCIYEQGSAPVAEPSAWFKHAVAELGIEYRPHCNVLVPTLNSNNNNNEEEGFSTTIDITTGSGADSIDAVNPAVNVVASLGAGDDTVSWLAPESRARLFLQLGDGADALTVQSAGAVSVDLGTDESRDTVTVLCDAVSPSVVGRAVFPVGVRGSDARLEISQWDSADVLEVQRFAVNASSSSSDVRESAVIAADVDGAHIEYQQNSNTDYHVRRCTPNTTLAFSAMAQGFVHARGANVEVALAAYETPCRVAVAGVPEAGSSVVVGVSADAQTVPRELVLSSGRAVFGALDVQLESVDHVGVAIPPALASEGTVRVEGAPAGKDVFVLLPEDDEWTAVVARDAAVSVVALRGSVEVERLGSDDDSRVVVAVGTTVPVRVAANASAAAAELALTSGCVESTRVRTLSPWVLARAREPGVELAAEQRCAAVLRNVESLALACPACRRVRAAGLGTQSVRSLVLAAPADATVELAQAGAAEPLWSAATISDNEMTVSRADNDGFRVKLAGTAGTVSVVSPVFAPRATVVAECAKQQQQQQRQNNYRWNLVGAEGVEVKHGVFADVNFTGRDGASCSGRITSRAMATTETAPRVRIGSGLEVSVLLVVRDSATAAATVAGDADAVAVRRYVNLTNAATTSVKEPMNELKLQTVGRVQPDAHVVWEAARTAHMEVRLQDRSENVMVVDAAATAVQPLHLSTSPQSALSFAGLGNRSVAIAGVVPAHFNAAARSFDLLGGKDAARDVFCFSPCELCSDETWNEVRVMGKPCALSDRTRAAACAAGARVRVAQDGGAALLGVSCGRPAWDVRRENETEQCPVALNAAGAADRVTTLPVAGKLVAGVLTVAAGVATAAGASVLLARTLTLSRGKVAPRADVNSWWLRNAMRDFFNDQFSWASLVLTACAGGVSDFDLSFWNGAVDAVVLETKALLFDWLDLCASACPPALIVVWVLALANIVVRVLTARKNSSSSSSSSSGRENSRWTRVLEAAHVVLSGVTLLLLPLTGFAAGVLLPAHPAVGVAALVAGLAIVASVPVGRFDAASRVRVCASYAAIAGPFVAALVAGVGAPRAVLVALLLVCAVALPLCNTFVLWKSFFAGADTRTAAWKRALFWTFGLRAASLLCGAVFFSALFFELSAAASAAAFVAWLLWTLLPPLQLVPLTLGARFSNIRPVNYLTGATYEPINSSDERSVPVASAESMPLIGAAGAVSASSIDKDLPSILA